MDKKNKTNNAILIVANSIPLIGVLFLGWDGKSIIVVYILETILVGIINVLKMLTVYFINKEATTKKEGFWLIPFFIFHFNFFIFVQSVLFFAFSSIWIPAHTEPFQLIANFSQHINNNTLIALGSLLAAQLTYLLNDFVLGGQYKTETMSKLMFSPYKRIFLQQFLVIIGGFVFMLSGGIAGVMVLFVALKAMADYLTANYANNPKIKTWVANTLKKEKDGDYPDEVKKQLDDYFNNPPPS